MNRTILAIAGLLCAASAHAATVYTGVRNIGGGTVNLSITTDDTLGVLTGVNILDWTIGLDLGANSFTLLGSVSGNNSALLLAGGLSATATELKFDFTGAGMALFQYPFIGSSAQFYCLQTTGCYDSSGPGEGFAATDDFAYVSEARSGEITVATTGGSATPEPAT